MAMMISWVMPVNPSHPYLENDPAPSFAPTICAFHLGFSLGSVVIFTVIPAKAGIQRPLASKCVFASYRILDSRFRGNDGNRRLETDILKPESTDGRPWGQPLKQPEGAPLNLG